MSHFSDAADWYVPIVDLGATVGAAVGVAVGAAIRPALGFRLGLALGPAVGPARACGVPERTLESRAGHCGGAHEARTLNFVTTN